MILNRSRGFGQVSLALDIGNAFLWTSRTILRKAILGIVGRDWNMRIPITAVMSSVASLLRPSAHIALL